MIKPAAASPHRRPSDTSAPGRWWTRAWFWASLSAAVALVPFLGVFSTRRSFFTRDLGFFFWDQHVWLRRSLFGGEWPLWDAYLAAGQSAAANALHQMFLLPVLAIRLMGTETVAFNLWVALPFPLAALGAFLFFGRRFSPVGAALGAITFAVSGPVVSAGNFPNLSWSVAAMPWVLWAVDRCEGPRVGRRTAVVAGMVAFQALSGEPVTLAATSALAMMHILVVGTHGRPLAGRLGGLAWPAAGIALGAVVAAVQLVPMTQAVADSWRPFIRWKDFWSFHPLVLAEVVSPHLFGNFFQVSNFDGAPWMRTLNSGREPFFYSVYVGSAALSLALMGVVAGWRRAWSGFWAVAGLSALVAAFGGHTPIYPLVRDHLPLVGSFRFPVKYLLVSMMAVGALVACGWDAIARADAGKAQPGLFQAGRRTALAVPVVTGTAACLLLVLAAFQTALTARAFFDLAGWLGVPDAVEAARFMLRAVPDAMPRVAVMALVTALLVSVAASARAERRYALPALWALVVVDLSYVAWPVNPTCDASLLAPASWSAVVRDHPDSRFYFGGKMAGTIEIPDADAPKDYRFDAALTPMERRTVFGRRMLMCPTGTGAREMLAYDLAVLWPRVFEQAHVRFVKADDEQRGRFLSRSAVRYRVLPDARGERRPASPVEGFVGVRMFDWGADNVRAAVVPGAIVVADQAAQLEAMFAGTWDASASAMLMSPPGPADGVPGQAVQPGARIVRDAANSVSIDAGTGAAGGYLVLLDSYSPDWRVRVDGRPGTIYQSNLLFRAVRLAPGRHRVDFDYRPRAVFYGAGLSIAGLIAAAFLAVRVRGDAAK